MGLISRPEQDGGPLSCKQAQAPLGVGLLMASPDVARREKRSSFWWLACWGKRGRKAKKPREFPGDSTRNWHPAEDRWRASRPRHSVAKHSPPESFIAQSENLGSCLPEGLHHRLCVPASELGTS